MRHFGIDEANDLIPILKKTFEEVRAMAAKAQDLFDGEPDPEQLLAREKLVAQIQQKLQPLTDMGIEVKAIDGLVDFRALRNGKTVYLCWKFGEEEVTHWHELDTGFAGRRPIDSKDEFAPTYLS